MERKIDLENINGTPSFDIREMYKSCFVDVKKKLEYPPIAISLGEFFLGQSRYDIPFGTLGNFSVIVGASKVKKTFFKSLLVAAYIGGTTYKFAEDLKSHRTEDKYVLDFDTEQGKWHAQNVFKRVGSLVGDNYVNYKPFYLRDRDYTTRLEFIEYLLLKSSYSNKIGLVAIDGLADLVGDVNDLAEANDVVQKLMTWTAKANCHLIGVLHKNFGETEKATGHLGSAIMKKSESVCLLAQDKHNKRTVNIKFSYTRGFPIDPYSFTLNKVGLPVLTKMTELTEEQKLW